MMKNESRLITGCSDSELRFWEIKYKENNNINDLKDNEENKRKLTSEDDEVHKSDEV